MENNGVMVDMTFLLVLLTVITIIAVQYYIGRRRQRAANVARARSLPGLAEQARAGRPPADYLFHPGHTWVRVHDRELVSIGSTDFALNFVGTLSTVELPAEGARLQQGQRAWTLVSSANRRLGQVMPIEGRVVAVNTDLLANPRLAQESPYDAGWLLRVKPRDLGKYLSNLMSVAAAGAWIDGIRAKVTARLSPALGTVALDGGEWGTGFGERFEDVDWEALVNELFPSIS